MTMPATNYMRELKIQDMYDITSEYGERYELVNGMLHFHEPPGFTHGDVAATLVALLHPYVKQRKLGKVVVESGYILTRSPDTVRGPDISFVRSERIKGKLLYSFFDGAPDLAIEILSPKDCFPEVEQKLWQYFQAGCQMVWVIDPRQHTVTVRRPDQTAQVLEDKDILNGQDIIPGFTCRVFEIFT